MEKVGGQAHPLRHLQVLDIASVGAQITGRIPSQFPVTATGSVCIFPTSTACSVHRRGLVLWFRKTVPVDLTDRLGCSDIRRSLRTSNVRVARQRAWSLVLVIEEAVETLRRSGISPEARDVFARIIGALIDDFDRGGR